MSVDIDASGRRNDPADSSRTEAISPIPVLSVVVPIFEHWHLVPRLMQHLEDQTLSAAAFEIILVVDGPSVPAATGRAKVYCSSGVGSYAARNRGALESISPWLVFTDADCRPRPEWLEVFATESLRASPNEILIGRVVVTPANPAAPNRYEIYDLMRGIPQDRYARRGYGATANLAVPKTLFDGAGAFDGTRFSGGDAEFCHRATRCGASVRYMHDAIVEHPARADWSALRSKARRIKGGQLTSGPASRRAFWFVRTMIPPFRGVASLLTASAHPIRHRIIASVIQCRLWVVEVVEAFRLLGGSKPERR